MKQIRYFGTAIALAAIFAAVPGGALASAPHFVAKSYPATLKSETLHRGQNGEIPFLTTVYASTECRGGVIESSLSGPSETLPASYLYGSYCGLSANTGCPFIFHPPATGTQGTMDIAGPECKGVQGEQGGVHLLVLPQTGIPVSFEAVNGESGSSASMRIYLHTNQLKYEITNSSLKGSYSNGSWTTGWEVEGFNGSGTQLGIGVREGELWEPVGLSISEDISRGSFGFNPEVSPATIGAEQISGVIAGKTVPKLELSTAAGNFKCATATFTTAWWLPGGVYPTDGELPMTPSVSGCTLAGTTATVSYANGCKDRFYEVNRLSLKGSLEMCETKIAPSPATKCVVTVLKQSRGEVQYANVGTGSSASVDASPNLSGLQYEVAGGEQCPNAPTSGLHSDGQFKGVIAMKVSRLN